MNYREAAALLKTTNDRKVILKQMRKDIRQPVPAVRKSIKARALSSMPKGGGLNKWVAATRITAQVKVSSRAITVKLKGGRNSRGGRSDIKAIDRGRLRAPTWGHKPWHTQAVPSGFFSEPAEDSRAEWIAVVDQAVDTAIAQI